MELMLETIKPVILYGFNLLMISLTLTNRKKVTGKKFWAVIAAGFAASTGLGAWLFLYDIASIWPYSYIASYFALTLLICKLLYHCRLNECTFLYFVVQTYLDDTFMLAKIVQFYVLRGLTEDYVSFFFAQLAIVLLGLPVMCVFAKRRLLPLADTTEQMRFWKYIWLVPFSFYLVYRLGISFQYMTAEIIWGSTDVAIPLLWAFSTGLSYVLLIDALLEIVNQVEEREKLQAVSRQLLMQEEQYQKLSAGIEETKRIRHDLKHQFQVIAAHADQGDWKEIRTYVGRYLDQMDSEEEMPLCPNHAVDSIVHYYMRMAKKMEISMNAKLETLQELPCDETDLCVILGNLLDNAVEACARQKNNRRFIDVKLSTGKQNLTAIQITNSCEDAVRKKGKTFLSTKRDYSGPGIGISSVSKITDKYHGVVKLSCENNTFEVKVLLNKKNEWEQG